MGLRICIDAGHFANYNCNTHVTPTYWESRMAWKLHLMQKEELEQYEGVSVRLTRTDPEKDLGVVARGQAAVGCDLLISDHSNGATDPSVDWPVAIYPVNNQRKALAQKLTDTMTQVMGTRQQGKIYQRWNSANNADYYGVIRGAASVGVPAIILEHSFHSNDRSAAWLLQDSNLRKLAVAEAAVIAAEFGCKRKAPANPFVDVKEGKSYYDAVLWAVANGITNGTDAAHFSPDKPCTRGQMVTFLKRLYDLLQK